MTKFLSAFVIFGFLNFSTQVFANTNTRSLSQEVVILVNKERARLGLRPVSGDYKIAKVADGHAKDMYRRNYFSHKSLDGSDLGDRLQKGGVQYFFAGENIAKGQQTSVRVMKAWMNSPGHRKNILNPQYGRIGVAKVGDVWVQNFSN